MKLSAIIVSISLALLANAAQSQSDCGRAEMAGSDASRFRVAIAEPASGAPSAILVLLAGGGGFVDLDERGCARALTGNSLIRSIPAFRAGGVATALVDAPADHQGREGLGGFRIDPRHAAALGALIAQLRGRYGAPVWIVGTSRGAISAANAASRLIGPEAPDGVVLTSPVTVGSKGNMAWVIQSVFDLPLDRIRQPLLLVGHAGDRCLRSPADKLPAIAAAAAASRRQQTVIVTGGPGSRHPAGSIEACEGREPHGFAEQEADVAAGILRFVHGGAY